ncbi:hypothetical protein [Stigmatella erecta]|uniref:Lipoprotein n=1 Tax=Stigmatella erecta TaxID=83460 RepID=A0A1I0KJ23_9BACT|nr:hypothetical protein [Stigmatella erecta]SEU24920.1 hypothetical protein SAMN05443639_111153 [Stigmatella erecta]
MTQTLRTLNPWTLAALTGALLGGACTKEPAPAPAEAPQRASAEPSSPAPGGEAAPGAEADEAPTPSEGAEPSGEAAVPAAPESFQVGQQRNEVMRLFAGCAERKIFMPGGNGALYVEVYQPKPSEECFERLGKRQFTIRGGELFRITDGLMPESNGGPPPGEGL